MASPCLISSSLLFAFNADACQGPTWTTADKQPLGRAHDTSNRDVTKQMTTKYAHDISGENKWLPTLSSCPLMMQWAAIAKLSGQCWDLLIDLDQSLSSAQGLFQRLPSESLAVRVVVCSRTVRLAQGARCTEDHSAALCPRSITSRLICSAPVFSGSSLCTEHHKC